MATLSHKFSVYDDGSIRRELQPAQTFLYRVLTDAETGRTTRPSLPMVFVLAEDPMPLKKEWQLYLCAINPGMDARHIVALLDTHRAFANNTGFNGDKPRANFITNANTTAPLPSFDKVRTCGGAVLQIVAGYVTLLDGSKAPPPVEQVNPQSHPHLFFAAVNTGPESSGYRVNPFPNGALYPWYKNGTVPVTWLPHVAPKPVSWPLGYDGDNAPQLIKLP